MLRFDESVENLDHEEEAEEEFYAPNWNAAFVMDVDDRPGILCKYIVIYKVQVNPSKSENIHEMARITSPRSTMAGMCVTSS